MSVILSWLLSMSGIMQAAELYHTNRAFTVITFAPELNRTVEILDAEGRRLTNIVVGTNIVILATNAIEKQAVASLSYGSPEGAWNAVVNYNDSTSNYPAKLFDNVGWVRGTEGTVGGWGAYLCVLQNKITFRASTADWWRVSSTSAAVVISKVLVGSLGDFDPLKTNVDIGPRLDAATNNFPGTNQSDSREFKVDYTNVFYRVTLPVWITPRSAYACVGGSNVQYTVTGTNIPQGVNWEISPTNFAGHAEFEVAADFFASVIPGTVAINYKVRATSKDNTNFYDEVDLGVRKVDIVETNIYLPVANTATLHLTADSSANTSWEIVPSVQNGAFIQGSSVGASIVFNAGSIPINYTVKAYAEDFTNCFDTCTVTVLQVEIEKCDPGFLPQGGTNDNTTTIRAFVTPNTVKGSFKFTLFDVSDEKGYCMNAPWFWLDWDEDADTWKDYQFPSQYGFSISGTNRNIAKTVTNDLYEATKTIKSFDYGSFGKIKAEFTTADNSFTCIAREVNGTNEYTRLPADTNGNDIADAWSGDTGPGVSQGAIDDLDNRPAGDGTPGDHLSRYQEYRGFIVQEAHVRTDPTQKDVFCRNHNIPAAGLSGFLTTDNLGAPVHAIRYDEWDFAETRRINPMNETHVLDPERQTAIKVEDVEDWRDRLGSTLSELWGGAGFPSNELSVPNTMIYCVVDVAKIQTNGTELVEAATPSTNVIYVTSVDGYQTNGAIKIDDEIISYSGVTTNEYEAFIGCSRGAMDTTKASHNEGAAVMNFANADEVIQLVFGHEAGHVVGLKHTSGNNIMIEEILRGSYLNNGYWHTYAPALALTNEFRVKP